MQSGFLMREVKGVGGRCLSEKHIINFFALCQKITRKWHLRTTIAGLLECISFNSAADCDSIAWPPVCLPDYRHVPMSASSMLSHLIYHNIELIV